MPDAGLLHKHFDYGDGSRELDENLVELTTTMACKACGWRDQGSDISRVEARHW